MLGIFDRSGFLKVLNKVIFKIGDLLFKVRFVLIFPIGFPLGFLHNFIGFMVGVSLSGPLRPNTSRMLMLVHLLILRSKKL